MRLGWPLRIVFILIACAALDSSAAAPEAGDIDWERARQIYQKSQRNEPLTADEQAYLQKAKEARASMRRENNPGEMERRERTSAEPKSQTCLVPLTDLTEKYNGEEGGLYGAGRNDPPPETAKAAKTETAKIQPLDDEGKPSPDGKIVLLSIGMSNTTQEFSRFVQLANSDPQKSPQLVIVDGAQGGQSADRIADENAPFWSVIAQRLKSAGVSPQQVEAAWVKEAIPNPHAGFPAEMQHLKNALITDIVIAKKRYPNLRVAYLSSRTYGGYAVSMLNPEPYAYQSAFAVRWVIQDQMKGEPKLNYDPAKGEVKAPLLLWGPYLWADGVKGRKIDGLIWNPEDFGPDGTHPNATGRQKVAEQLLGFFKTDPNAQQWFLRKH